MPVLFDVFLSLVRIFMLISAIFLTYILGHSIYNATNGFLNDWYAPCLEIISYLVLIVPIFAIFYGIKVQKLFWKRENHYNKTIFVASFFFGVLLSLLPVNLLFTYTSNMGCVGPEGLMDRFVYMIATGTLSALFAFVGMDIGVLLKHSSHHLTHNPHRKKHKTQKTTSKTSKGKKSKN